MNKTRRKRASFRVEALIYSTCDADYDAASIMLALKIKHMEYVPFEREGGLEALAQITNVRRLKKG